MKKLLSSSAGFTAMRLAGAGAGFLTQLLLARALGASDLGVFYAVTSLALVASILAGQGFPAVMARFVDRYSSRPPLLRAFGRSALRHLAVGVAVLCAGAALLALTPFGTAGQRHALLVAIAAIPFLAVISFSCHWASAFRRFALCYIPETLGRPVLFLAAVAVPVAIGLDLSADTAILLFTGTAMAVAVGQGILVARVTPPGRAIPVRRPLRRRWAGEARLAVVTALFTLAFGDLAILVASTALPSHEVALFGVSLKLAVLIGFFVQVAHHLASVDLAQANRLSDEALQRRTLRRAILLPTAVTLAATVGAVFLGDRMLALFDETLAGGTAVLVVLLASQMVRAVAGPSVTALTAMGAQRANGILCAVSLGVLVAATLVLAPLFGALGAAIAVLLSTLAQSAGAALVLARRGGFRTDIAALIPARRRRAAAGTSPSPA